MEEQGDIYTLGRQEEAGDLVKLLQTTRDMEEQGDILHYMAEQFGLMFKVSSLSSI